MINTKKIKFSLLISFLLSLLPLLITGIIYYLGKNESERLTTENYLLMAFALTVALGILNLCYLAKAIKNHTQHLEQENRNLNTNLLSTQDRSIIQDKLASIGYITAGIAHEIKNPLNFINNFAQLSDKLLTKIHVFFVSINDRLNADEKETLGKLTDTLDSNLKKIIQNSSRAESIVRNILDRARKEPNKGFQKTNINTLLDENLRLSYHSKRAQDSSFNLQMDTQFDPSIGDIDLLSEEFGRVILNIINNAFYAVSIKKSTAGNNYTPILRITTKNEGDNVRISFYDNGNGIPKGNIEKLYTPFFTTKPTGEGIGLGLSLSKEIIETFHKGKLFLETEENEFSNFIIILPRKQLKIEG
jgi:signal transduction histidine kinase